MNVCLLKPRLYSCFILVAFRLGVEWHERLGRKTNPGKGFPGMESRTKTVQDSEKSINI